MRAYNFPKVSKPGFWSILLLVNSTRVHSTQRDETSQGEVNFRAPTRFLDNKGRCVLV